ncbi:hypothetical protein [Paractinoplanes durhamensis]|uniref:hypothetical protein n=1 Tax=Paractinoplanes durhamensis TaxID=113563 RepID=UPI001943E38B|nr:hypothetical protein [Actinoplanes durhamensis]
MDEERDSTAAFEFAAGAAAVIAAAFIAAAAFGWAEPAARVLTMAVAAGLVAAVLTDWRARAAVAALAALIFVGFLAHRFGQLSGDPAPWRYTPVIGLAALLGGSRGWLRAARHRVTRLHLLPHGVLRTRGF